MKKLLILMLLQVTLLSQTLIFNKVEPPNWWSGMKLNPLQLMVYGHNLAGSEVTSTGKGVKILKVYNTPNPDYLFFDVEFDNNIEPGNYTFTIKNGNSTINFEYPVLKREKKESGYGFGYGDIIYLLMPDRFSNGDKSNDSVPGYSEGVNRDFYDARHGGDLKGLISRLDYIKELGVTTIWSTPFLENNTFRSYHGYAATDFYKVDPRLGSNELYREFVETAHSKGLKVILDHVTNHFSKDHPWTQNLPVEDWINGKLGDHLPAMHHKQAFLDPYGDSLTINRVIEGWFTDYMPDINQTNEFMANYIINNTIWWIEYSGIDGIREDTYPYNHQGFMSHWAKTILEEYPGFSILGEVWTGEPSFLAYYQGNSKLKTDFNTHLQSLTDFGLRDVLYNYLEGKKDFYHVYSVLCNDYLYSDPNALVTFIDNHDINRSMFGAKEDLDRFKNAYTLLFTTRGIPQIFYGTELGVVGTERHGELRANFPGGWEEDSRNAFTKEGRTDKENEIYDYLTFLINLRKNTPAFHSGKLTHFPPNDGVYTFFRESGNEKYMVCLNGSSVQKTIPLDYYDSQLKGYTKATDVRTGNKIMFSPGPVMNINSHGSVIYKLEK